MEEWDKTTERLAADSSSIRASISKLLGDIFNQLKDSELPNKEIIISKFKSGEKLTKEEKLSLGKACHKYSIISKKLMGLI